MAAARRAARASPRSLGHAGARGDWYRAAIRALIAAGGSMGRIQLATRLAAAVATAVLVAPSVRTAHAVVPGPAEGFAPAQTRTARSYARGTEVVPVRAAAAFDRLVAATGAWRGVWDLDTDVPVQLWGAGIAAAGANADAAIAERAARALIEAHLDLLAPGSTAADLELIGNATVESIGLRTVTFAQRWNGLRVVGATVSAVFKRDRLILISSSAKPDISATIPSTAAPPAATAARRWLAADTKIAEADLALRGTAAPVIFPEVRARASAADRPEVTYTVARPLAVEATAGIGKWTVWVDAATGEPLARASRLLYAQGVVTFNTPERSPDGVRVEVPAAYATLMVDGVVVTTDHAGRVIWPTEAPASVVTSVNGPYIQIVDGGGNPLASTTLTLPPGTSVSFAQATEEFPDAQITAAAHGNLVKQHFRRYFNPRLPWVDGQMIVSVNEPQVCNAFADLEPDQIHFFIRGVFEGFGECNNTARIPDVVYHETGHNVHFRSLQANGLVTSFEDFFSFEIPGLSEGMGDSLSASITQSALVGPGFLIGVVEDEGAIRNNDPVGFERRYPDDIGFGQHSDGQIIAGALFDLHKVLKTELGDARGRAVADRAHTGVMSLSTMFLQTYGNAIAADDDDGNLANGTPHQCAISKAFEPHGLTATVQGSVRVATPTVDAGVISVAIENPPAECPGISATGVTATWQVRGDASQTGTIPLAATGSTWSGALPVLPDGTVVQYQLAIALSDGSTTTRPYNAADPFYETYVGAVTAIRCDDFEVDAGWTHGAATGVDEWARGPGGLTPAAGDPTAAYGGTSILGTDVEANGLYAADSSSYAEMPAVDTTGYATVRLQYRRWLDVDNTGDFAAISVGGGEPLWQPVTSGAEFADAEWRFHDVDLTASAAAGSVAVRFELETDATGAEGGWALDDVCVVGIGAVCGDGLIRGTEACDDTNTEDGDGCSALCVIEPDTGGCCSTGTDPRGALTVAGLAGLGLLVTLRRRRRP
jgi:MYXO-CTERM domain-containing protein